MKNILYFLLITTSGARAGLNLSQEINNNYAKQIFNDKKLFISPLNANSIALTHCEKLLRKFGDSVDKQNTAFASMANRIFYQEIARKVKNIIIIDTRLPPARLVDDTSGYFTVPLMVGKIKKDTLSFLVPQQNVLRENNIDAEICFCISEFTLHCDKSADGWSVYAIVSYLFWDYEKNTPVAHGRIKRQLNQDLASSTMSWEQCFSKIIAAMYKKSPFPFQAIKTSTGKTAQETRVALMVVSFLVSTLMLIININSFNRY